MTGYTVHTGSSEKFSTGWDAIFQSPAKKKTAAPKKAAKKSPKASQKSSQPKAKKGTRKKKS